MRAQLGVARHGSKRLSRLLRLPGSQPRIAEREQQVASRPDGFERALEAVGPRGDLLLALGDARLRAGETEKAREAFRAVTGDAELRAHAALGFSGLGVTIIAVDREAVNLLQDALETAKGPLRARLLSRLAIETYYESTPEQRKRLVDEAVKLDPSTDALNARHAALWSAE